MTSKCLCALVSKPDVYSTEEHCKLTTCQFDLSDTLQINQAWQIKCFWLISQRCFKFLLSSSTATLHLFAWALFIKYLKVVLFRLQYKNSFLWQPRIGQNAEHGWIGSVKKRKNSLPKICEGSRKNKSLFTQKCAYITQDNSNEHFCFLQ